MRTKVEIIAAFTPSEKLNAQQQTRLMKIQNGFMDLATDIEDLVPECPDRSAALRKLLESKWTCVQAITHYSAPAVATKEFGNANKNKQENANS